MKATWGSFLIWVGSAGSLRQPWPHRFKVWSITAGLQVFSVFFLSQKAAETIVGQVPA